MRPFLLLLLLSSCGGEVSDRLYFDTPEVSALTVGCAYKHVIDLSRETFGPETLLVEVSNGALELDRGFKTLTRVFHILPGSDTVFVWMYGVRPGQTLVTFTLLGCCSKNLVVNVFPEPPAE